MKSNKWFIMLLVCLFLAACKKNQTSMMSPQTQTALGGPLESLESQGADSIEVARPNSGEAQFLGTSSGGGGFADSYAMETLDLAKYALAQMIKNTSKEVFSKLPEGKRKTWIIRIIENISYEDVEKSRYDRPLKFNYDLKAEKIYATKYYSSTFPYGRFKTRTSIEKMRILNEVMLDILHELSHFYEIGNTEESDDISDKWASDFLRVGLNESYICQKGEDHVSIHAPTGMVFVPEKDIFANDGENELVELSEIEQLNALQRYIDIYGHLSFLETDADGKVSDRDPSKIANIENFEDARFDALVSLALSNESNTSVRLEKYKPEQKKESEVILDYDELSSSQFFGVFGLRSGGALGAFSRFDSLKIDGATTSYYFLRTGLIKRNQDSADTEIPLNTKEAIIIDRQNGESKHVLDTVEQRNFEIKDLAFVEKNSTIKCTHHFKVIDNNDYEHN